MERSLGYLRPLRSRSAAFFCSSREIKQEFGPSSKENAFGVPTYVERSIADCQNSSSVLRGNAISQLGRIPFDSAIHLSSSAGTRPTIFMGCSPLGLRGRHINLLQRVLPHCVRIHPFLQLSLHTPQVAATHPPTTPPRPRYGLRRFLSRHLIHSTPTREKSRFLPSQLIPSPLSHLYLI